jgi:transposase
LHSNKIAGVVDSARQTIGLPMEPAECEQLKHLATKLLELRQQRKQAEVALQGAVQRNDELASISSMVGCATAGVLTARLGNLVDYTSVRALLRAPGLNLKEHSSGKKRGQLSLSKRGSSTARRWLYLATLRWIKANATVRAWYERKARRTDIKHKAIVALMRKLLAALYHVARGAEFDETKLFDCRRLQLS